jgi:hypothetical protein
MSAHIARPGSRPRRPHDRRITRSTASCTERASCNDGTDHRTDRRMLREPSLALYFASARTTRADL